MSPDIVAAGESRYLRSCAAVDILCKEEETRQHRVRGLLLKGDLRDAEDRLAQEYERTEEAVSDTRQWQDTANNYARRVEQVEARSKAKEQELESLQAEILSLQTMSAESKSLLSEKLALARDLSNLKTELEHLRLQVSSNQNLLGEKLNLQQELSNCRDELKDAKRSLKCRNERETKFSKQEAQYADEIQELKSELASKKRNEEQSDRKTEESDKQMKQLRKELEREKHLRENAEKAKASTAAVSDEMTRIKDELQVEKQHRTIAEKQLAKSSADWEAEKAVLDDKLDQFRSKLRTTKETLKETQAALQEAQEKVNNLATVGPTKKGRKRGAAQMDPDAAIGTPGDAAPNKRNKRATSVLGEKSTFSITPFLNRTTSVAPESPRDNDEPLPSIEGAASPSAQRAKSASIPPTNNSQKVAPLEPASISGLNKQPIAYNSRGRKKPTSTSALEKVTEENDVDEAIEDAGGIADEGDDVVESITTANSANEKEKNKAPRLSLKPKKSLSSFASFREGSLPPEKLQKKKRKLLGGAGVPKTLFDEDEDGEGDGEVVSLAGAKALSLGNKRSFGAFGGKRAFGGLGLLSGAQRKGPLVVANDGFMFSPLKRQRKPVTAAPGPGAVVEG